MKAKNFFVILSVMLYMISCNKHQDLDQQRVQDTYSSSTATPITLGVAGETGQVNYVHNSGFESGSKGNWTNWNNFTVVSDNQQWGNYCAKLATNSCSAEQVVSNLTPNTEYTLTAYVKVMNGGGEDKAYLGVKEFGGDETHTYTTSTSYQLLTVNFTTGPSSTSAKIYLWRDNSGTSGGAYGDEVCLSQPNKAKLFWLQMGSINLSDALINAEAKRRSIVVLNAWEHDLIAKFKNANPAIKVLVYKDLSSTRSYAVENGVDHQFLPCGVGYKYARDNHPEWFLRDASGNELMYSGYPGHYQMDVGNDDYVNYWCTQVISELNDYGWDGAFLDNALLHADQYHEDVTPAQYPSDESIQNAYKFMLSKVNMVFNQNNKLSIANASNARLYPGTWNSYMSYLSGGLDEWWLVFSSTDRLQEYDKGWSAQMNEVVYNETNGKITLVQPHAGEGDNDGFYYAFASYWLANKGKTFFSNQVITDNYKLPSTWRAEYDWDMGVPCSNYYNYAPGIYRREFTRAMVIVNSNAQGSAPVTINLSEKCIDETGIEVNEVKVNPLQGRILRKI